MKHIALTISTALLVSIFAVKDNDSAAARHDSEVAAILAETLKSGEEFALLPLVVSATSAQAQAISDAQLEDLSVAEMVAISSRPSPHFIGRMFSYLQAQQLTTEENLAALAKLPTTPRTILNMLSLDGSEAVRTAVASNPAINAGIAANLLRSETKQIRYALALNPNFALVSSSAASDFISEVAGSSDSVAAILPETDVAELTGRIDYYGHASALLAKRIGEPQSRAVAQQFVAQLGQRQ